MIAERTIRYLMLVVPVLTAQPLSAQQEPLGRPVPHSFTISANNPTLQVLPGPAVFADRALAMAADAPPEKRRHLRRIAENGPFSNNVREITGEFQGVLVDRGARGDEAQATAQFWIDGADWRVVIKDVEPRGTPPLEPHWGGVAAFRPLHGTSGNHNPFVPLVNAVAMWGTADVYLGAGLVRADAPVHVMFTSDTRGEDFRYQCYDCRDHPMQELHMILLPGPETEPYPLPGGFIHIVWEDARMDADLVRDCGSTPGKE